MICYFLVRSSLLQGKLVVKLFLNNYQNYATTLNITTLRIVTPGVLSIKGLFERHHDIQHNDTQHNDIQHNLKYIPTLSIMAMFLF